MKLGHRTRLFPTGTQARGLAKAFGCARFVFNQYTAWREWEHAHGYSGKGTRRTFTEMRSVLTSRNKAVYPWLGEVSSVILQEAVDQADKAYRQMVAKRSRGLPASVPRRRKYGTQSVRLTRSAMRIRETDRRRGRFLLYIPKIGEIKVVSSRDVTEASSATVGLDPDGTYWASFTIEVPEAKPKTTGRTVGIDVGLHDFAVVAASDGTIEKVANPKFFKHGEKKLAKAQQALSRKRKRSSNYRKARVRAAKVHAKIRNQRHDFLHQLSHETAIKNHVVCLETLGIQGIIHDRKYLAKPVHDAAWRMFINQIDYKTRLHGGRTLHAPAGAATSQTCALCGHINTDLTLADRTWQCPACGHLLDRDANAAVNIIDACGLRESLNACGGNARRTLACAVAREAGTRPEPAHPGHRRNTVAVTDERVGRKPRP